MFGFTGLIPTVEADVYAFGLVIYQVCDHDRDHSLFTYIFQVLTGRLPFPGLGMAEIAMNVVLGARPIKPENALQPSGFLIHYGEFRPTLLGWRDGATTKGCGFRPPGARVGLQGT